YNTLDGVQDVILTSIMKQMDQSCYEVVKETIEGDFKGCTNYIGTLANGGVDIAPYHDVDDQVPDALKAEVEDLKAKIISGEIKDTGCISFPQHCPGGIY
ncbi:MAG: hypothetical protein GX601_13320, partial [Anaerolineales bacterium]|nr:hypothetical protein [Anaerolineales bacterium]